MRTQTIHLQISFAVKICLILLLSSITLHCDRGANSSPDEVLTVVTRADVIGIFPNPPIQRRVLHAGFEFECIRRPCSVRKRHES